MLQTFAFNRCTDGETIATVAAESWQEAFTQLCEMARDGECNMQGIDLQGRDLSGMDLHGLDLRQADLDGVLFVGSNLNNADLSFADLTDAVFENACLDGCIGIPKITVEQSRSLSWKAVVDHLRCIGVKGSDSPEDPASDLALVLSLLGK